MAALQVDHQCLRLRWHSWHHAQLDQEQHAPSITPYMPPHHLAPRWPPLDGTSPVSSVPSPQDVQARAARSANPLQ